MMFNNLFYIINVGEIDIASDYCDSIQDSLPYPNIIYLGLVNFLVSQALGDAHELAGSLVGHHFIH